MKQQRSILFVTLILTVALGTGAGFNQEIRIADGDVHDGDLSTVNGGITLGDGATIQGAGSSINGSIAVGTDCRIERLSSVNGSVNIGKGSRVENGVSAVNGRVAMDRGSQAASVSTINGKIELTGADIDGDLKTINGNIALREGASVGGDIVIEDRGEGSDKRDRPLKIELEGGSVVEGNVIVEDDDTEVEIYLRDGSAIRGSVDNATVIRG